LHRDTGQLRDEHLRELAGLPWLNELSIHKARIGDEGLRYVSFAKQLRSLDLSGSDVSDKGLAHLSELTQLEFLNMSNMKNITGSGFIHLGKFRKLTYLRLTGSGITDLGMSNGIQSIKNMDNLKSLDFSQTNLGDDGLVRFKELPQLLKLSLAGTKISDRGIASLRTMNNLKEVDLEQTAITDEGCGQLAEIKTIQALRLGYTGVTLNGLTKLKQLPQLRSLEVSGIRLRREEVYNLRKTLTDRVRIDGNTIRRFNERP
jgi:Leucine-rich repeat (LRR) protein